MRTLSVVALLALVTGTVLAGGVTIAGRVVAPEGAGLAGATVRVASDYRAPVQAVLGETTVGEDGAFALSFTDDAVADHYVIAAGAEGYVTGGERVEPGAAVELRLSDRTMPVRGRVTDEAGRPIAGALVRSGNMLVRPLDGFPTPTRHELLKPTATTDVNGEFELRGLFDGTKLGLWVDAEGFGGWRGGMDPETFPVTHEWTITLQPEGVIAGRALGDGQPIEGLRVSAHSQEGYPEGRGEAVTDADGRFEMIGLWPSTYEVLVATGQDWIAPAKGGVTVEAGARAEGVEIERVRTAEVHIRLIDADTGEPVTPAYIRATSPARPVLGSGGHMASADETGCVTFHLPPGRTELEWIQLSGRGRAKLDPGAVEVPAEMAGQTMEVVVRVHPALIVSGMAVGPDDQPVAGAILIGHDGKTLATTDADGQFRVMDTAEGLPFYGNVRGLVTSADEGLVGILRCDVGAADVRVTLTPAAEMLVRIEDENGNPVEGVELAVGEAELRGEHGRTVYPLPAPYASDAEGIVHMGPLPSGVDLMPNASDELRGMMPRENEGWRKLQMVTLEPGETRDLGTIVVVTQKRSVSGIVLQDGEPVAGATVMAATDSSREGLQALTGADGRFAIEDLPPVGDVTLVAMNADRKLAAGTIWYGEPAGPLTLELLPTSSVQGRAIAADGRPGPGTKISVSATGVGSLMANVAPLTLHASTQAGEDGRWCVDGLIAGFEYRVITLEPMHEGGPMRMAQEFGTITPLGETEPFVVDIDLRPDMNAR